MRYRVFMTVWGARYVAKFLELALPTHFSPGNLGAVAADADVIYTIYTDRESVDALRAGVEALDPPCPVEFAYFDEIPHRGGTIAEALANSDPRIVKHTVQRISSHHLLARAAEDADCAVLLLDSDFILGDGALANAHTLRRQGRKVAAAMHMRLSDEAAGGAIRARLAEDVPLTGRELVGLGLERLHHVDREHFVDSERFTAYPSHLNWRVGTAGFVTHCFFPHPLMVVPPPGGLRFFSSLDYEIALRASDDDGAIHLSRDSDDMLICKISADSYRVGEGGAGTPNLETMARFAVDNTNIRHRLFMEQPIRFRAGGTEAEWQMAERESTRFVGGIYKAAELIIAAAEAGNPRNLVYLKSFLGPIEDFMSPATHARLSGWIPRERGG